MIGPPSGSSCPLAPPQQQRHLQAPDEGSGPPPGRPIALRDLVLAKLLGGPRQESLEAAGSRHRGPCSPCPTPGEEAGAVSLREGPGSGDEQEDEDDPSGAASAGSTLSWHFGPPASAPSSWGGSMGRSSRHDDAGGGRRHNISSSSNRTARWTSSSCSPLPGLISVEAATTGGGGGRSGEKDRSDNGRGEDHYLLA